MSFYSFYEYVSVSEKKERNTKAVEKLKKKNPGIAPISVSGRKLASSWWGKSWNKNLESYSDYANRMGRGRSYLMHGAILDLQISTGKVTALVQGSKKKPYEIEITIKPLEKTIWDNIATTCEGKLESLQELLDGKFPKALGELFLSRGNGLFPAPKEIELGCSCPDYASMCKHVAAALYGVGARLDENPKLFFTLRDVSMDDLISKALVQKTEKLISKSGGKSRRVIEKDDVSDMFGIDIGVEMPDSKPVPVRSKGVVPKEKETETEKEKKSVPVRSKGIVPKEKETEEEKKSVPVRSRGIVPKETETEKEKKSVPVRSKGIVPKKKETEKEKEKKPVPVRSKGIVPKEKETETEKEKKSEPVRSKGIVPKEKETEKEKEKKSVPVRSKGIVPKEKETEKEEEKKPSGKRERPKKT